MVPSDDQKAAQIHAAHHREPHHSTGGLEWLQNGQVCGTFNEKIGPERDLPEQDAQECNRRADERDIIVVRNTGVQECAVMVVPKDTFVTDMTMLATKAIVEQLTVLTVLSLPQGFTASSDPRI